ncbi:unnamed protein product [Phytomonas sp. Hart1]|nr:unnamed protein product [Phytomonas sp. Hart1]|eukprot:CCW66842.1 unnamed protein product [Phytomonas sp. isolate Hart1]
MLGKWIDQIQQKIDTAVDFLVEEDDEEEEEVVDTDRVNDQVVGKHGSGDSTPRAAFSQPNLSTSVSSSFQILSLVVEPKRRGAEETDATVASGVERPSVHRKVLDNIQAREVSAFQIWNVDLKNSHPSSTIAAHNATQIVINNQDPVLESFVKAVIPNSSRVSQHLENGGTNLASEEIDENSALVKANSRSTASVNESPLTKSILLNVGTEMAMASAEQNSEPDSFLLQSQEKSLEFVKQNTVFVGGEYTTHANKNQFTLLDQSSSEATNLTVFSKDNRILKGLEQGQTKNDMRREVLTSVFTNDEMPVIEEFGQSKKSNIINTEDRRMLLVRIGELELIVRDYQEKEDTWRKVQNEQQESLISFQHQELKLEEELKQRKACIVELSKKLSNTQQSDTFFESKLQTMDTKHTNTVNDLNRHYLEVQNRLENEIKDLREAMHRSRVELDEQACESERKICKANQRVHFATMHLAEAELRSANFLSDLKAELQDTQKRIIILSSALDKARNETVDILEKYDNLKREQTVEKNNHREHQLRQAAALSEANKEIQLSKRQVGIFQEKLLTTQREVEELKRRCIMLEAVNMQKTVPENSDVNIEMIIDQEHDTLSKTANRFTDETLSQTSSSMLATKQRQNDSVSHSRVFCPSSPLEANVLFSFMNRDDTAVKSCDRLEKEIIRQAAEIGRLKGIEMEAADLRKKLAELKKKNDLLLQMYGQLEEEYDTHKELLSKSAVGEHLFDRVDLP